MVYKYFDKKTSNINKGTEINSDVVSENKESDKELQKPVIRKFEKPKIHSSFIYIQYLRYCFDWYAVVK